MSDIIARRMLKQTNIRGDFLFMIYNFTANNSHKGSYILDKLTLNYNGSWQVVQ